MPKHIDADLIKNIDDVILCNNLIKVIFERGCSLEFTDHGIFAKDENENVVLESTADDPWWHKPKEG